jgi:hypothetical protein
VTAPATPEAARWEGWGTALKPAHEPVVVARKPLSGTVAGNVLVWGTGGLNIDGCRVRSQDGTRRLGPSRVEHRRRWAGQLHFGRFAAHHRSAQQAGGWSLACEHRVGWGGSRSPRPTEWRKRVTTQRARSGSSGVINRQTRQPRLRFARTATECLGTGTVVVRLGSSRRLISGRMTGRSCIRRSRRAVNGTQGWTGCPRSTQTSQGGQGKPGAGFNEVTHGKAPQAAANHHPTVKPVALMRHLVRLVTPPGGTVLDPFAGSGTTLVAAVLEGMNAIGCEMTDEYLPIIEGRVAWAEEQVDAEQPRLL